MADSSIKYQQQNQIQMSKIVNEGLPRAGVVPVYKIFPDPKSMIFAVLSSEALASILPQVLHLTQFTLSIFQIILNKIISEKIRILNHFTGVDIIKLSHDF